MRTKITLFLAFLAILIFGWWYHTNKLQKVNVANVAAMNDTISHYKTKIAGIETFIAERDAIILTQKEAIKAGLISKEELKKLNISQAAEITKLKAKIEVIRDSVEHNGQIVVIRDTAFITPKNAIILPFSFSDSTKFVSLRGRFSDAGKLSYTFSSKIDLNLYVGFEKRKLKAVATTTNPYIFISDMVTVKTDIKPQKRFNVGLFAGYGASNAGLSPFFGVGVGYSLIAF